MAYTLAGPAGNAAMWGGFDPNKAAQVAANTANTALDPANTWQNWGQNFATNVGGTYDPTQVAPAAPYDPMNGAAPGVSLGSVAAGPSGAGGLPTTPAAAANPAWNASTGTALPGGGAGTNAGPLSWNPQTGYGPGTGPGSSSTSFGVPPAIAQYLDPSMAFQQAQGLKALQSSAAAQGGLLSGPTLKNIVNYSQGLASTGYNNAFNQAAQQQGFGAGLSQQDWLNNLMLAQTQAGQGQYGTTGTANTNNLLATLLSQNALAAGNANAAGTIGGANAVQGGLSQAIANMLAQNLYNRIPALNPTGP